MIGSDAISQTFRELLCVVICFVDIQIYRHVETTSKAKSWQGKHGMQGFTELFHPLARKSFYWVPCRRQKVFEKIQGIRHLVLAEYGLH